MPPRSKRVSILRLLRVVSLGTGLAFPLIILTIEYHSGWFIRPQPKDDQKPAPKDDQKPAPKDDQKPAPKDDQDQPPKHDPEGENKLPLPNLKLKKVEVVVYPMPSGRYSAVATLRGDPGVTFAGKVDFIVDHGGARSAPVRDGKAEWEGGDLGTGKHTISAIYVPSNGRAAQPEDRSEEVEFEIP